MKNNLLEKNDLLEALQKKYGEEYNIEQVDEFKTIHITVYESQSGDDIYKLRVNSSDGSKVYTTWHLDSDTILFQLLNNSHEGIRTH
jgi:hypothetical protein